MQKKGEEGQAAVSSPKKLGFPRLATTAGRLVSGGLSAMGMWWIPVLGGRRTPFLDVFLSLLGFVSFSERRDGDGSLKIK